MKLYREGNKVIIEAEESDCNAMANTPEMVADAVLSGAAVVFGHMNKHTDEIIPPDAEAKIMEALDDYKERWEITPAVDPPAGGEDAR
jgi:hypothetical protein